jgi:hypothetical protein
MFAANAYIIHPARRLAFRVRETGELLDLDLALSTMPPRRGRVGDLSIG